MAVAATAVGAADAMIRLTTTAGAALLLPLPQQEAGGVSAAAEGKDAVLGTAETPPQLALIGLAAPVAAGVGAVATPLLLSAVQLLD